MNDLLVVAADAGQTIHAQSITQWINVQTTSLKGALQGLGIIMGLIVIIVGAIRGKFGIGRIIIAGLTGALIVWMVYNIEQGSKPNELIKDQVDTTNAAPAYTGPNTDDSA